MELAQKVPLNYAKAAGGQRRRGKRCDYLEEKLQKREPSHL